MSDQVPGEGDTPPPGSWAKDQLDVLGRPVQDRDRNSVEVLAERNLALPALAPAETPEAKDWPYYEARVSVHVRPTKPTETFGEGGDEMAHARAWTQAPDFVSAVERLDADLAKNWSLILSNAALVDQEPSPEVAPPRPGFIERWALPLWLLVIVMVMTLVLAVAVNL